MREVFERCSAERERATFFDECIGKAQGRGGCIAYSVFYKLGKISLMNEFEVALRFTCLTIFDHEATLNGTAASCAKAGLRTRRMVGIKDSTLRAQK